MNKRNFTKKQDADKLYERYVKPLEKDHWGQFIAVSPRGKTILGSSLVEVMQRGINILGSGNFIFKVGEKVVGKIGQICLPHRRDE